MKRFILIILSLFLIFINIPANAVSNTVKKDLHTVSADGFNIQSTLMFPKVKNQNNFKTVVFLHSLGYNSQWWGDLPNKFLEHGYAVLKIDFRGHGSSVFNSKLTRTSWKSFTNLAYIKFPDDIISVINTVKEEYSKKSFFNEWAIVGSDIGAGVGIIAADKYDGIKPKTIVMLSPIVKTRGIYVPVNLAQLDSVDILSISGTNDSTSIDASKYLKKFAQNEFVEYTSSSQSSGMVMLKNDEDLPLIIYEWILQYLK